MACDLTLAGYGSEPTRTMTWRRFWYAWLHDFLRRARLRAEQQSFQTWLVTLQNAPKSAQAAWQEQQMHDQQADRELLLTLYDELPLSIRPLLGLKDLGESVDVVSSVAQWWDNVIEQYPPGSAQARFYQAGKDAALGDRKPVVH